MRVVPSRRVVTPQVDLSGRRPLVDVRHMHTTSDASQGLPLYQPKVASPPPRPRVVWQVDTVDRFRSASFRLAPPPPPPFFTPPLPPHLPKRGEGAQSCPRHMPMSSLLDIKHSRLDYGLVFQVKFSSPSKLSLLREAAGTFSDLEGRYTATSQGYSNSLGAMLVRQTISMIKWIRTSRLSTKNSL